MEVCVAQAVPARKPYGCLFPIQKAWEDRKILTPAHTVSCERAFHWQTCYSRRASFLVCYTKQQSPPQGALMGRESCFHVMLHLGAKHSHPCYDPIVQQPHTVPAASPKHTWEWSPCPGLGQWCPSQCNGLGVGLSLSRVTPQWDLLWR